MSHYIIIAIVISVIVTLQILSFVINRKKILLFKSIFPESQNKIQLLQDEAKNYVMGIESQHKNPIFLVIIDTINKYLINNKNAVSDFHLMKDIIDRNCDAKEEAIATQIPVPLYLGLIGTMLGILIGVGFLVFTGGLNELLDAGNGSGAEGIEILLGGVALAMISSIIGILMTTFGSFINRNAKADVEKNKNTFLSWMQAKLLPNISNDTSSALVRMTKNLSNFNKVFSTNTKELNDTLSKVKDSSEIQKQLIEAINKLEIEKITVSNIEVYNELKNSTKEVGVFANYLQKTNEYLQAIKGLNQKLDEYEGRTQVIEKAGYFFAKNEKWLADNMDVANLEVQAAITRFKENTIEGLAKLQDSLNAQILDYDDFIKLLQDKLNDTLAKTFDIFNDNLNRTQQAYKEAIIEQQNAFKNKLQETSKLIEELKNLSSIKEGIKDFKKATNIQNQKIEELTKEIKILANAKLEGGTIKQQIVLPKWIKILIIVGSSLFVISCLLYIVPFIIEWISNLIN